MSIPTEMIHPGRRLTRAEVDLKALRANYQQIRRFSKGVDILAVVKADAYGHGMVRVAKVLEKTDVKLLGVSDVNEGIYLRREGIKKDILLFESVIPNYADAKLIIDYHLTPTVCTLAMARALNRYARIRNKKVLIHIKIDTGMRRLGVWHSDASEFIRRVKEMPGLHIDGIFTHFPLADTDRAYTRKQIEVFQQVLAQVKKSGLSVRYVHAANSMGLGWYKSGIFNLARPGLMLYGLYPNPKLKSRIRLKPVLTVKSKVIFLKTIPAGSGVSYGHTFVVRRPTKIATIPIGYNDGYWRGFSNRSFVLIRGTKCPVIGNVTMDQIMVDASSVKNVKLGDEVIILGAHKRYSIAADELAQKAGTINYEVVCSLGNRLPRVFKN